MSADKRKGAKNKQTGFQVCLLKEDLLVFYKMIFAFQELILSMVRNAAFVLPSSNNSVLPSSKMHKVINKKNFSYQQPIATREVFLYCLPNKSRKFYAQLIHNVAVKNGKVAINVNKKELEKFDKKVQLRIVKNLVICSNIMNIANNDFQLQARCKQRKIDK